MYSAKYKGILFVEGMPENCIVLGNISTKINDFLEESQLKSLDDVKDKMVQVVIQNGGNAVVDFKYGQKSSFWESLGGLDDVMWYASGKIAIIK